MCFGGRPSPQVSYQGPSPADVERNNQAIQQYRQQAEEQQQQLANALQLQIDSANKRMAEQQALLAQERVMAAAAAAQGPYAVTSSTGAAGEGAQTTEAIKPRPKKQRTSMTIASAQGTGLNIGT